MARHIKADGTESIVAPKGAKWTLEELQALVGGYIEFMPGKIGFRMVMNEEGRIKQLPFNARATSIVLEALHGQPLRYHPQIFGDVVLLDPKEKM